MKNKLKIGLLAITMVAFAACHGTGKPNIGDTVKKDTAIKNDGIKKDTTVLDTAKKDTSNKM